MWVREGETEVNSITLEIFKCELLPNSSQFLQLNFNVNSLNSPLLFDHQQSIVIFVSKIVKYFYYNSFIL